MAKVALLIGISEYGEGLSSLPGTQEDISILQRVLHNPQVGDFDQVDVLRNPDRTQMELAIETLFTENRSRDDLILLYFSGHGVRDDNGTLYFANCSTEKNPQGRIRTSTAVPAAALQEYMNRSRSKRQVLILDCCFSGAFANDMKAKQADEAIDVKAQLGGEGRAVLTSSTATQVSYEKEGASIYTRYLVQGLETGSADRDEDGHISVDELHEYAREQVRAAAPTMQPEIYAVREGYKIVLARAPKGDPRLVYRKELEQRAKQKQGKLSPVDQRALKFRWQELGLSSQEAEQIALQVLQPYQEFWDKLNEFEEAIKETLDLDPQLSASSMDDLRYFQRVLKLRDEDILPVLNTYHLTLNPAPEAKPVQASFTEVAPIPAAKPAPPPAEDDLSSEKGIDYTKLRDLLKAQKWKEANQETADRMLEVIGKGSWWNVESNDLFHFPCTDLKTIDGLWVKYSKGLFGFSVQKEIYRQIPGVKLDGSYPDKNAREHFGDTVGWRKNGQWLSYDELKPSFSSPKGNFPLVVGWAWVWWVVCCVWSLLSRTGLVEL